MIKEWFKGFVTAVQFLTRIPLPGGMNGPNPDPRLLRLAVIFFPLVGGLIGLLTGLATWVGLHFWPPFLAVLLALALEAVITGGFHEDAVADCCDGLGGGWKAEDVLRIMKDSRLGSYGALGLMLAVLMRLGGIAFLPPSEVIPALIASAGIGRWAILLTIALVAPLATNTGLANSLGQRLGWFELGQGTLLAVPAIVWYGYLAPVRCGMAIVVVVVGTTIWARYVRWRIGGVTGDCLGFACYLAQLLVLLIAVAHLGDG